MSYIELSSVRRKSRWGLVDRTRYDICALPGTKLRTIARIDTQSSRHTACTKKSGGAVYCCPEVFLEPKPLPSAYQARRNNNVELL